MEISENSLKLFEYGTTWKVHQWNCLCPKSFSGNLHLPPEQQEKAFFVCITDTFSVFLLLFFFTACEALEHHRELFKVSF